MQTRIIKTAARSLIDNVAPLKVAGARFYFTFSERTLPSWFMQGAARLGMAVLDRDPARELPGRSVAWVDPEDGRLDSDYARRASGRSYYQPSRARLIEDS